MNKKLFHNFMLLLLLFTFSTSLIACAAPPDKTVNSFFTSLQKGDIKNATTYLVSSTSNKNTFTYNSPEQEKIIQQIFSKLKCEIVSSSVEGNTATVKTKVTAPDLTRITTKMISELLPALFVQALSGDNAQQDNDKLFEQYFINSISDPNVSLTTSEIDIKLIKDKNKKTWLIQPDDNLSNAMTGNFEKAINSISDQLNKE